MDICSGAALKVSVSKTIFPSMEIGPGFAAASWLVRSFQDHYQSSVSRNPSKVSILFSPRHSYSGNIQQTRKKKKSVKPSSICNCSISHIWEHEFFIFVRLAVREILLKYLTFWGNFLMFSFAKKGIKILKTQNIVASALKSCLLHKKLK